MSSETTNRAYICGVGCDQRGNPVRKIAEELYRRVCEAALTSGDFRATAIFLQEPGTSTCALSPEPVTAPSS